MKVLSLIRRVVYLVVITLFLLLVHCFYGESSQRNDLHALCQGASGAAVSSLSAQAVELGFEVKLEAAPLEQQDWFDREYLRLLSIYRNSDFMQGKETAVIFAKPGVGYYACILSYDNDKVMSALFQDHSS